MSRNCGNCKHYDPLKGEPPAGYCGFMDTERLPYWIDNYRRHIESLGADVLPSDGAECDAHKPS